MTDKGEGNLSFEIRAGGDRDLDRCLDVLNRSYATERFTADWFRWKHEECPFGASRIWIATGPSGMLGLFFALPWTYRDSGSTVAGVRTVDGATLPAARGQRVLGALIAHEYRQWDATTRPGVLVATATEAARRSHVRNGALALDALHYAYGITGPRFTSSLDKGDHVLDDFVPSDAAGMGTDWSPQVLRWRTDIRSGNAYDAARLRNSDTPNGLVFRVGSIRGLRILVPIVLWGSETDRARLVASTARSCAAPLALAPSGPGAEQVPIRRLRAGGHAWVCVWDRRIPEARHLTSPLGSLAGWRLSYGELEGLV